MVSRKDGMNIGLVLIVVVVGVILYIIAVFNSLQSLKTQIVASIQEIGNQLKRQASLDRKSTRLNSSHQIISYAVFCLKKKMTVATFRSQSCLYVSIVSSC